MELIASLTTVFLALTYLWVSWRIASALVRPLRLVAQHTPAELGFPAAERLEFHTVDRVKLCGWLVPSSGARAVILLHGINSHAWDGQSPDVVRAYVDAGFHVLVFDFRGQGQSQKSRTGLGWTERLDVRAAVDLLLERGFKSRGIGIHGTSFGAATGLLATAAIPEVAAVIADSPFADVRDLLVSQVQSRTRLPLFVVKALMPGIKLVTQVKYSIDLGNTSPEGAITLISPRPILLIHGGHDTTIPVEHSRRLLAAAVGATELWVLPGLGHTEGVRLAPDYNKFSPLREMFLTKVVDFFDVFLSPR